MSKQRLKTLVIIVSILITLAQVYLIYVYSDNRYHKGYYDGRWDMEKDIESAGGYENFMDGKR